MPELRTTDQLDPRLSHDCDRMQIDGYRLREVLLPPTVGFQTRSNGGPVPTAVPDEARRRRRAIEIVIHGRNFTAMAQPLMASVGEVPVSYLRIAPDERSIQGLLLAAPRDGARVRVTLGDVDDVQHATPYAAGAIDRIG